jgi:glycosyltransferase involved in cell wall biosynthesis
MSNNKDNQNKNNKNNQNKNNQNKNNKNKNKEQIYDLALLCQFQNSKNILRSWLQHHIWQGFQHFYLIDDNSTDGSKEILQEFIDNGVVTHFTRSGKKVDNYRWAFQQIRAKTKWLAICDVNDFFYGVNKKLVTMIKQHIAPHFDMVLCNGFCYTCENEDELYNPVCNAVSRHPLLSKSTKYIFRVKSVVHPSQIWLESLLYPQTKLMMTKHAKTLFTNTIVRLNHYEMSHNDNDKNNDENICESKQYLVDTTLKDLVERTPENY